MLTCESYLRLYLSIKPDLARPSSVEHPTPFTAKAKSEKRINTMFATLIPVAGLYLEDGAMAFFY
jgi:hypothetical protein